VALLSVGYGLASLEKGCKLLEQKGTALIHFSCLIVTGTVMLNLFYEGECQGKHFSLDRKGRRFS
jgi:hypothetical protein